MASSGFEGSQLEEIVNYSVILNHTGIQYCISQTQYRIMYMKTGDIVEKDEDY